MAKKPVEITREHLDKLRARFDELQGDRKAYFDTYEATKRANEQQLKELRDMNKELRRQLADLQREGREAVVSDAPALTTGSSAALGSASSSAAKLEGQLKAKRMLYNTLRAKTQEKKKELTGLGDHLRCAAAACPPALHPRVPLCLIVWIAVCACRAAACARTRAVTCGVRRKTLPWRTPPSPAKSATLKLG